MPQANTSVSQMQKNNLSTQFAKIPVWQIMTIIWIKSNLLYIYLGGLYILQIKVLEKTKYPRINLNLILNWQYYDRYDLVSLG